jgi:arylsulfatase A-like enzyme
MNRPNFVSFMPDQLRSDAVGAFGNPVVQTPHIDALAQRGTVFTNAFAQHSVCSQSRASIFTGWYPHVAGHRTLTNLLKPWEPNLLRLLRDAGYNVAWAGHRGDTFAPGVLDASTDFNGFTMMPSADAMLDYFARAPYPPGNKYHDAFYFGRRADTHALDFDEATVQTAEAWLADGPREPWILFIALVYPHPPFFVEEPWYSMHDRADVPLPPNAALADKPRFMQALRDRCGLGRLDEHDWREIIGTYYGMVARVDDQLGRVVAAVDRADATAKTAFAFFTDHGEYLGDFGLVEKWPSGLDDCLLRNPFVVSIPDGAQGMKCDDLVEMVDLLPTLLELADVEVHHTHFGRSLVPLLVPAGGDPEPPHRMCAFSEGGFTRDEEHLLEPVMPGTIYEHKTALEHEDITLTGRAASVRTPEWTYVYRLYEGDELYDRAADPRELVNLHGRPEHEETERMLRDIVLEWMVSTADVIPWDRDPRMDPDVVQRLFTAPG